MKTFIGVLIGAIITLGIIGFLSIYELEAPKQVAPSNERSPNIALKYSNDKASVKKIERKHTKRKSIDKQLYQWLDNKGNKVVSDFPPKNSSYELYTPDSGISSIEMIKPKQKKVKKIGSVKNFDNQYNLNANPKWTKEKIVAKNHTHCRWVVGRAKMLYQQILSNKGSQKSIWCEEHIERVNDMRKLAREGNSCFYPHRTPASCFK